MVDGMDVALEIPKLLVVGGTGVDTVSEPKELLNVM